MLNSAIVVDGYCLGWRLGPYLSTIHCTGMHWKPWTMLNAATVVDGYYLGWRLGPYLSTIRYTGMHRVVRNNGSKDLKSSQGFKPNSLLY